MDDSSLSPENLFGSRLYHMLVQQFEFWRPNSSEQPWFAAVQAVLEELAPFKHPECYDQETDWFAFRSWNLYALSRVNDFLLLPFQGHPIAEGPWGERHEERYLDFFAALGFIPFDANEFASFRHEIVQVIQAEDDEEPISVLETLWPGWMWGEMLFARSGVVVRGGRNHVVKEVAEGSTLYFTYHRHRRPTDDLSIGWGSNSQWRTEFRRDYESDGEWFYNIDGDHFPNCVDPSEEDRDHLTLAERIELCKNRCFLTTTKNSRDLWPYDDRYDEIIT